MVQSSQPSSSHGALPWELRRRGLKDSLRHDQRRVDDNRTDQVRQQVPAEDVPRASSSCASRLHEGLFAK